MYWLLPVVLAGTMTACEKRMTGEGPVVVEERHPENYSRIVLQVPATTYITQSDDRQLTIEAQQNILDLIETPVSDGELRIKFREHKNLGRHEGIIIRLSNDVINGLRIEGSGTIQAITTLRSDGLDLSISGSGDLLAGRLEVNGKLSAHISGSGNMTALEGLAGSGNLTISGSGSIRFLPVVFTTADAGISGSGDIRATVEERLDASISGSGSVYYQGNPAVHANISGSGSVKKI